MDLARAAEKVPARRRQLKNVGVTESVQQVVEAITEAPAWIRNARHDPLAANRLARALYAPLLADPRRPANNARFIYPDPASHDFCQDWERAADDIAAMLRSEAGRNPYDKQLIELIGELSTRSEDFPTRWAAHNVRFHRTGVKSCTIRSPHPLPAPPLTASSSSPAGPQPPSKWASSRCTRSGPIHIAPPGRAPAQPPERRKEPVPSSSGDEPAQPRQRRDAVR